MDVVRIMHKNVYGMMTSSNGKFVALLAIYVANSPVPGEFPAQRPVTRSFGVFFDLRLNKRLSKQSWGWWFDRLSRPLWRHRNGMMQTDTTPVSPGAKGLNLAEPGFGG